MSGLRWTVLVVRFGCELGMLAGLAYWGFTVGEGAMVWVLGIGAPFAAALVWALFVSPKARRPVSLPVRLSIEIDLFIVTALALWFADARGFALALGSLGIASSVLNAVVAGPTEAA